MLFLISGTENWMQIFPKRKQNVDRSDHRTHVHCFFFCFFFSCLSEMNWYPENTVARLHTADIWLPTAWSYPLSGFLEAVMDCDEWQSFPTALQSPWGCTEHGHIAVSYTVLPMGFKITHIQLWFPDLSLMHWTLICNFLMEFDEPQPFTCQLLAVESSSITCIFHIILLDPVLFFIWSLHLILHKKNTVIGLYKYLIISRRHKQFLFVKASN